MSDIIFNEEKDFEEAVIKALIEHAWRDEYGATFIIFTIKEMMKLLHLGNKKINKMLKKLEAHNLIYRSHQGLRKPNKIYVYDLLKADNSNWLPKQFKHRKGQTNEKEIL